LERRALRRQQGAYLVCEQAEFALQKMADTLNRGGDGNRVRLRLEPPFGSVRW
jgi:hypothetical protein